MARIVLDTSVMVAGWRSNRGAAFAILERVNTREVIALTTTALFLEYEAVLKRPEHRDVLGFSEADVDRVLGVFARLMQPVEIHFRWRPQLPDPADELVLEAAVNGRADALVTYNVKDFAAAAPRFGVSVLTPPEFLEGLIDE
jgi:putative PIN family toxin of toxin-antitoxin system